MSDEYSQLPAGERPGQRPSPAAAEDGVEVPYDQLQPDTLAGLIEAFILREGTDYGEREVSVSRKVEDVRRQLERGEIAIVFDLANETCSLVPRRRLGRKSGSETGPGEPR